MALSTQTGIEWKPLNTNDTLNAIETATRSPHCLSFKCSHLRPSHSHNPNVLYINSGMLNVFKNATCGNAYLDMQGYPGHCEDETHHFGNIRGVLCECSCEDLNRIKKPGYRNAFENDVISAIIQSPKIQKCKNFRGQFEFNLVILCSGGLLGEEILLFRLFDKLKNLDVHGTINLFLIDWGYKNAIQDGKPNQGILQFLQEICSCLPYTLKLHGSFFSDGEEYIAMAKSKHEFKHDLLIAEDIETSLEMMEKINQFAAYSQKLKPHILAKKGNVMPSVSNITPQSLPANNYQPISPRRAQPLSSSPRKQTIATKDFPWELALGCTMLIALITIIALTIIPRDQK